jgi:hypothetical protein
MNEVHHPLHNLGQFLPIGGLDAEREPLPVEPKPAHFEVKSFFRLTKHTVQQHDRPSQPEERLANIDRRPHLVPHVFRQITFHSHNTYPPHYICGWEPSRFIQTRKNAKKDEKSAKITRNRRLRG